MNNKGDRVFSQADRDNDSQSGTGDFSRKICIQGGLSTPIGDLVDDCGLGKSVEINAQFDIPGESNHIIPTFSFGFRAYHGGDLGENSFYDDNGNYVTSQTLICCPVYVGAKYFIIKYLPYFEAGALANVTTVLNNSDTAYSSDDSDNDDKTKIDVKIGYLVGVGWDLGLLNMHARYCLIESGLGAFEYGLGVNIPLSSNN